MAQDLNPLGLPLPKDDPERDLAYWLESAGMEVTHILRVLYERYGESVQRLAMWLLTEGSRLDADEVRRVVERTFNLAQARLVSFRGQESVSAWMMGLALDAVRIEQRRRIVRRLGRIFDRRGRQWMEAQEQSEREIVWRRIEQLPEKLRIAMLLRFAGRLSLAQIALVIGGDERQVHELLNQARSRLLGRDVPGLPEGAAAHADLCAQALAVVDDLADVSIYQDALEAHLATCAGCREVIEPLRALDAALPEYLVSRWPSVELPPRTAAGAGNFQRVAQVNLPRRMIQARLWDVLLIGGVLVAVMLYGWNMARQDTHRGKPMFQSTPAPTAPPLTLPAARTVIDPFANRNDFSSQQMIFTWQPQFSADGRWLAYSRLEQKIVDGLPVNIAQVLVMDTQTHQSQAIGEQDQSGEAWFTFSPALSADGRYLAFESNAIPGEMIAGLTISNTYECPLASDGLPARCRDVFVSDRQSGEMRLVSQAQDGGWGNWNSGFAAISADGRYVAFWSAANNLLPAPSETCAKSDQAGHCGDIYVRDLHSGVLQRIPVGRSDEYISTAVLQEMSISQDGRWLALTILQQDEIAPELRIFNSSEAYLYDLHNQTYLPLNHNPLDMGDAGRGNSASRAAALSADGRYAVFASQADNLAAGDHNNRADVFLLDRQAGRIELISISSDGAQGDEPSGAFIDNWGMWGEQISVSADGRFVAFMTSAAGLSGRQDVRCSSAGWYPCVMTAVRDRQEQKTTLLIPPLNAAYLFPALSADGRWLGLIHYDMECPRSPTCSVTLRFNMQTGELLQAASGELLQPDLGVSEWIDRRVIDESGERVNCLAAMPGEMLLAGGLDDGRVIVWDMDSGAPYKRIAIRPAEASLMVSALAFSPDGKQLAVGWWDGDLALLSMPGGELITRLDTPAGSILSLAFSPDGEMLAVGGMGVAWTYEMRPRTLAILDYNTYSSLFVKRVAFSPDGRLVVHGLSDGSLWLRSARDGSAIAHLAAHDGEGVTALAFSSDGRYLADGGDDGRVNIWRLEDAEVIERILSLEHKIWISDLLFLPDSSTLLAATAANGLRVWKIPAGEVLYGPLGSRWDSPLALAFSYDYRYLALASSWGGVKIWEWSGGQR